MSSEGAKGDGPSAFDLVISKNKKMGEKEREIKSV